MMRTSLDHLPFPIRQELDHVAAMVIDAFGEALPRNFRTNRLVRLILHGPHARPDWSAVAPGQAIYLLAIVDSPKLARKQQVWGVVRDRLRRAWELGEIVHPVRLAVHSLDSVNRALAEGIPHFVTVAAQGIVLHEMDDAPLVPPRRMPEPERQMRANMAYTRWHDRATAFQSGAAFYVGHGDALMAALMLHQACEHLYHCAIWTMTLHGPRTHALDHLREVAEGLEPDLLQAWPRDTPFERRAFGCIRRAYVEVRYGQDFRISTEELAWAMARVDVLDEVVAQACHKRFDVRTPTPSSVPTSSTAPGDCHVL